jgi:hypothetical protein
MLVVTPMYAEHSQCQTPEDAATLWRYMDLSKLVSILNTKSLFFVRVDRLWSQDPWEGASSPATVAARKGVAALPVVPDFRKRMVAHHYVSCWHENAYESLAMWKLYCAGGAGVAIRTTTARFKACFHPTQYEINIARVTYFAPTEILPEGDLRHQVTRKRASFSHEKEVRAICQDLPDNGDEPTHGQGVDIHIDIDELIEDVYVEPTAADWIVKVVQATLHRFGLNRTVQRSSLSVDPVF